MEVQVAPAPHGRRVRDGLLKDARIDDGVAVETGRQDLGVMAVPAAHLGGLEPER